MKKNVRIQGEHLRCIVTLSLLSAMSIVLGKFLAIPWGNIMRFSLENTPIFFAGVIYGPIAAGAVALVGDLVGCLLVGYAINPLVTLGGVALGVIGALLFRLTKNLPLPVRVCLSVLVGHVVGSVGIKTLGLAVFYSIDLFVLMLWRLFNYVIVGVLDATVVYLLLKSPVASVIRPGSTEKRKTRKEQTKMSMTYSDALAYIHSSARPFCKPGLERITALLDGLSHPERELKIIHVGGTNGKGSTSSMLASVLEAAGYRVGLYTSPYILEFNERIRINGENISNEDLAEYTERIRHAADAMSDSPTEFEIITAIAFAYFKDRACDYVVLEVGLGGRFDATNVTAHPLLSIITGISLDHIAILGDTIEKIAAEKAGIIKPSHPTLFGGGSEHEARDVIRTKAEELSSPYFEVDKDALKIHERNLNGCSFDYKSLQNVQISLLGTYQPYNAITVIDAVEILRGEGVSISESALRKGLFEARWMARFEILQRENPLVIFDGAHNAEGIRAATDSIKSYFGDTRVYVLTGVLRDKDYTSIAEMISTVADRAFTITPQNSRALDSESYAALLERFGTRATSFGEDEGIDAAFAYAYAEARENRRALIVLGSLYTYKDVYHALKSITEVTKA